MCHSNKIETEQSQNNVGTTLLEQTVFEMMQTVDSESAEMTSLDNLFQIWAVAIGKARQPTV